MHFGEYHLVVQALQFSQEIVDHGKGRLVLQSLELAEEKDQHLAIVYRRWRWRIGSGKQVASYREEHGWNALKTVVGVRFAQKKQKTM